MIDPSYLSQLEKKYGLPEGLLQVQMQTESSGNPNAVSPKGALGLFQFMPKTAQEYGINPLDPLQAAEGAARKNADLLREYKGNLPMALAAYNAGQGTLAKGTVPNETVNYVNKIMGSLTPVSQKQDLSGYTDEELAKIAGEQPTQQNQTQQIDLSGYSDEDLAKIAGEPIEQKKGLGFLDELKEAAGSSGKMALGGLKDIKNAISPFEGSVNPVVDMLTGAGKTALGTLGIAFSPLTAFNRAIPGAYLEEKYGVPRWATDLGLSIVEPAGISKVAKAGMNLAKGQPIIQAAKTGKTAADLKAEASSLYEASEKTGGAIKEGEVNKWINDISSVSSQTREGKAIAGETEVTKLLGRIETLKDKPVTLRGAQEIHEELGNLIDKQYDITGKLSKEGHKILDIQTKFRDMIENAPESAVYGTKEGFNTWREAQKKWAESMRLSDIERILQRAELSDNPATAMRSGFKTLYMNKARLRGFSREQQSLIKKAATSNLPMETMRGLGSRLVSIIAFGTGRPEIGIAAQGIGYAARSAAEKAQLNRANKIIRSITGEKEPSKLAKRTGVAGYTSQQVNQATKNGENANGSLTMKKKR